VMRHTSTAPRILTWFPSTTHFCAPHTKLPSYGASFSRSYGCNLPSSFRIVLSSALVFSTIPPVSVWGTVIMCGGYFLAPLHGTSNPIRKYNLRDASHIHWPTNINVVPIDYAFLPRLRGRLTLRRLALRRNPWNFGVSVSHTHLVTHVSILTSDTSSQPRS